VKLSLLDGDDSIVHEHELAAPRAVVEETQLQSALEQGLGAADAVGHRIVHGGERFQEAVAIDQRVEEALRQLTDLAPLHQPKSLAA
jgi:acetate kinase